MMNKKVLLALGLISTVTFYSTDIVCKSEPIEVGFKVNGQEGTQMYHFMTKDQFASFTNQYHVELTRNVDFCCVKKISFVTMFKEMFRAKSHRPLFDYLKGAFFYDTYSDSYTHVLIKAEVFDKVTS